MDDPVKPPSQQARRFFDVMPPSQSRPSATSRPVIVGNQPEQTDTMVHAPSEPESTPVPEPIEIPAAITEPEPAVNEPQSAQAATAEFMMQEEYDDVHHEILPASVSESAPSTSELSDVAPVAAVTAATMTQASVPVESAAEPESTMPGGAVHQPVVVHHHQSRSLGRDLLLMLLLFVLIVGVVDMLLDSGAWKPTYNFPHTHFIKK